MKSAHATLPASDIDRAKKFYADTLGLELKEEREDAAVFAAGDTTFMIYPSPFAGTNEATAVGFQVDDLTATLAELRDAGVEILEYDLPDFKTVDGIVETPSGPGAWIKDSEGNILGLGEWDM